MNILNLRSSPCFGLLLLPIPQQEPRPRGGRLPKKPKVLAGSCELPSVLLKIRGP